jgi:hypothetical protein
MPFTQDPECRTVGGHPECGKFPIRFQEELLHCRTLFLTLASAFVRIVVPRLLGLFFVSFSRDVCVKKGSEYP